MKKISILLLLVTSFSIQGFSQVDRSKAPQPAPAREIKLGEYQTFTLKNGLQVFVVENHKLPRVQFVLELKNNPIMEGEKAGYVSMAGELIGTGTKSRTKAQLDEEIDFIGASLNTSSSGIFGSSLSKHRDKLLELLTDVLYNPSFSQDELDKLKTQTLSALAANKEDPNSIARNVRSVLLYGKNHPYGEITTEKSVEGISIDDCKKYFNTYFKPNNAYLAIVGDINLKTAKKLTEKYFGKWQKGEVVNPTYDLPKQPEKTFVALVDRPASVQSVISVSYPVALKPGEPDVIKSTVLNQALGGGFSSRLMQNLREDKAYTYGASSSLRSDRLVGSFNAGASVRNEVTDSAVHEFLYELKNITKDPITDQELASAKAAISGSFGRSLESPQTVASFALNTARYNLPKDYYATYVKRIGAVTKEDVLEVAGKYIRPENACILVVGKGSDIADKLERFGEVKYFDTNGDPYTPSKSAALPAGLTAEKVIDSYLEAIGGVEKIQSLKTVKTSSNAAVPGATLVINTQQKAPNKLTVEVTANGMVFQRVVCDGKEATMTQMGQKVPMDDKMRTETIIDSYIVSELFLKETGVKVTLMGAEKVEGVDAYLVEYEYPSGGGTTSVYFDRKTGLKLRVVKSLDTPQGSMTQTITYQDYKAVEGVKFPHTVIQDIGPQSLKAEITSIEVNVPIDDKEFVIE